MPANSGIHRHVWNGCFLMDDLSCAVHSVLLLAAFVAARELVESSMSSVCQHTNTATSVTIHMCKL